MLGRLLASGRIPVQDHLQGEDGVEREAGDEAVEDDFVGDFLQGGEDAGEGAEEVGEDLRLGKRIVSFRSSVLMTSTGGDETI